MHAVRLERLEKAGFGSERKLMLRSAASRFAPQRPLTDVTWIGTGEVETRYSVQRGGNRRRPREAERAAA